ncbi:MAG: 5-(carboxyamino)imidazole ribonucleotide synthase [Acidobacteria bacterium]|nr:5-(carboxyamino)imidazole ribonucleotide synthase [Acidobacteriota bacterium]
MRRPVIGIIGAGQLALMMAEASERLDVDIAVLGAGPEDPALRLASRSVIGDHLDRDTMLAFAAEVDVVTFDHELVDVDLVAELERSGHAVRPGSTALAVAVDKRAQYEAFLTTEIPMPRSIVAQGSEELRAAIDAIGLPLVIKHARGGYDGRGVTMIEDPADIQPSRLVELLGDLDVTFVVQDAVAIDSEIAVQVVRSVSGEVAAYPVVRTVQEQGICRMVQIPAAIDEQLAEQATASAMRLAEHLDVVGILAVEFFVSGGQLLVNEIAARPHNSGHITIESSATSQFENHLRAVAGFPLGSTDLVVNAASMVNVIGIDLTERAGDPPSIEVPADAAVHLYGKSHRPGRKLGHVTAVGDSLDDVTRRARRAAEALELQGATR